jgi:exonuclease SbcD
MKFLHAADLHAGRQTHGRVDPRTGINSAVDSAARCWAYAVGWALDNGCEFVLVAGDAFDTRNPDAATLALFSRQIRALKLARIPLVLLAGNHDGPMAAGRLSILDALEDRPYVYALTRPEVVEVAGIRIAALPWASKANLAGVLAENENVGERQIDLLRRVLDRLRADADADVLTLHWPIAGSVLGTERDVSIIGEPMLSPADLEGFRYVAAGHLHRAQPIVVAPRLNQSALAWYSGGIDRFDFGDEGQDKGALEVILGSDYDKVMFHATPARRLVTIQLEEGADPAIEDVAGAIVRIRGLVTQEIAEAVNVKLRGSLLEAGADHVLLELDVQRSRRPRVEAIAEATDPLAALRLWIAEQGDRIPPAMHPRLEELAGDLMGGRGPK